MNKVIITGSVAYDYIMDFPGTFEENILPENLKKLSVSFLVRNFSKNFGGVAGNIAYTLSLLNQPATLFTAVGEKDFDLYQTHLTMHNIDTSLLKIADQMFTANAFIMTDTKNCQIAGFYPGALELDDTLSLQSIDSLNDYAMLVVSPTAPKAMRRFTEEAVRLGIPYLYDPAQQLPHLSKVDLLEGVKGAEIVIGNDYELELLRKKTELSQEDLLQYAKAVITTLGDKGSIIETGNDRIEVTTAQVPNVIDPTGAGDAYIGGLLAGYLRSLPLKTCGQIGALAASYAIQQYGTQNHHFTMNDFKEQYQKVFHEALPLS
jgi:adenosine kinase